MDKCVFIYVREADNKIVGMFELIYIASETIKRNYDKANYRHTVTSEIRCKDGKVYKGVNVYSIHGACAEMIAEGAKCKFEGEVV